MVKEGKQEAVSWRMKLGYGVGDFGANLLFQCVGFYLLFYFTDVSLIEAGFAGTIILVAKLWDAVSDPMMGVISDRTRSRWGSKRLYLLLGALPLGLSFYLLFFGPALKGSALHIYALLTFIFFCTCYTVVNVPYGALTSSLSRDAKERASISGYRMTFALIGTLVVAGVTLPLVGIADLPSQGFRTIGAVFGLAAVFFTVITFLSTREKVGQVIESKPFREEIAFVFKNSPFLILTLATLFQYIALGMIAAMVNYFFKYALDLEEFIPVAYLVLFVTAIVAMPLWVYLSGRRGKLFVFNAGMVLLGGALSMLYFVSGGSLTGIIFFLIIAGLGLSTVYLSPWSMIADTVEYSEWKYGVRREGTLYGFFYFAQKLAFALAGFICGVGLSISGYVPNVVQSPAAEQGIRVLMTFVPAGMIVVGVIAIYFYPISNASHADMVRDIENRSRPL